MTRRRWIQIGVAGLTLTGLILLCSGPYHAYRLTGDLRSSDIAVWEPAARKLLTTGPAGVRTVLHELGTRAYIINLDRALAFEPEASLAECLPLLQFKEPWLRCLALRALGLSQRWAGELAPWADKGKYPRTSKAFIRRVAPKMVALVSDNSDIVRENAVVYIAEIGAPALPALWTASESSNHLMRLGVAKALGKIPTRKSYPVLRKLTKDEDERVRDAAAYALKCLVIEDLFRSSG